MSLVACGNNAECSIHCSPPLVVPQSAEQIAELCRSFNDTQTSSMEGPRESQDPPPRPLARHLSDADRLRKVIQELVDTEKSYVKVRKVLCTVPSCVRDGQGHGGRAPGLCTCPGTPCARQSLPLTEGNRCRGAGGLRGWGCLEDSGKMRFSAHFVTKVAFTMETDVLVCHLQSVGRESVWRGRRPL